MLGFGSWDLPGSIGSIWILDFSLRLRLKMIREVSARAVQAAQDPSPGRKLYIEVRGEMIEYFSLRHNFYFFFIFYLFNFVMSS